MPSHQSQSSYLGGVSGTSPPALGWSAPSPLLDQYGAPVEGQTTYTQQVSYNPQFVPAQYSGYAEPSGLTDPSQYGNLNRQLPERQYDTIITGPMYASDCSQKFQDNPILVFFDIGGGTGWRGPTVRILVYLARSLHFPIKAALLVGVAHIATPCPKSFVLDDQSVKLARNEQPQSSSTAGTTPPTTATSSTSTPSGTSTAGLAQVEKVAGKLCILWLRNEQSRYE